MQWRVGATLMAAGALAFSASLALGLSAASLPPERKILQHNDTTSSAVGLRGYRRFHANDSLIGQAVDCSHQEKICFRFNRVYNFDLRECVDWSDQVFELRSHRLKVVYPPSIDCNGYVMAFDDRCYRKEVMRNVICGCATEPTRHFLNGVECRCVPAVPVHVEQPQEDGKCLIPDLRFPDETSSHFYQNPYEHVQGFASREHWLKVAEPPPGFNCSMEQLQCFAHGKVWANGSGCVRLLERGPCREEHVIALDVQAVLAGRMESTCVNVRGGCPPGHVRMLFDGSCHNKSDVENAIRGKVRANQFGLSVATNGHSFELQPIKRNHVTNPLPTCAVLIVRLPFGGKDSVATTGQWSVKRYEVVNTPPVPE